MPSDPACCPVPDAGPPGRFWLPTRKISPDLPRPRHAGTPCRRRRAALLGRRACLCGRHRTGGSRSRRGDHLRRRQSLRSFDRAAATARSRSDGALFRPGGADRPPGISGRFGPRCPAPGRHDHRQPRRGPCRLAPGHRRGASSRRSTMRAAPSRMRSAPPWRRPRSRSAPSMRAVLGALAGAGYRRVYSSSGGLAGAGAWLVPRNTVATGRPRRCSTVLAAGVRA